MPFADIWDVLQPPDTQLANLLGQDIRNLKIDIQQRMGAISGTLATRWDPSTDAQPLNWTGLLYFTTDTNQIFRWSGTAWVDVSSVVSALPALVAKQTLTNQAASTGSLLLYTVPTVGDGLYRVTLDSIITTTGTGGTISMTVGWNNGVNSLVQTSPTTSLNVLGQEEFMQVSMYLPPTQSVTFGFTLAGVTGSPRYSARARLEYLGV